eukprot:1029879-Alexandrium_andersonii.AAC.1
MCIRDRAETGERGPRERANRFPSPGRRNPGRRPRSEKAETQARARQCRSGGAACRGRHQIQAAGRPPDEGRGPTGEQAGHGRPRRRAPKP